MTNKFNTMKINTDIQFLQRNILTDYNNNYYYYYYYY